MTHRILLVDGANLVMRAAFGGDVEVERAVQVATGMLGRAVQELRPTHGIIAFDPFWSKKPTWRRAEFREYKANRTVDTSPYLIRAGSAWELRGWATIGADTFEADDVIATLVDRLRGRAELVILSNDSDLLALAGGGVTIARWEQGAVLRQMNAGDVAAKYGIPSSTFLADWKALVGESGDNVPGVQGIGPKKASALITKFGCLEAIIDAGRQGTDRDAKRVASQEAAALRALRLVTLRTDAPIPPIDPARCALAALTAGAA